MARAEILPLFPLRTVVFPGMDLPIHVFEERYQRLLHDRRGKDPLFGVVLIREGNEAGDQPRIHDVGTATTLVDIQPYDNGRCDLLVRGTRRFRVLEGDWRESYLTASITWLDEPPQRDPTDLADLHARVRQAFGRYLDLLAHATGIRIDPAEIGADPVADAWAISAAMPFDLSVKQRLLQAGTPADLLTRLHSAINQEWALLQATGAGAVSQHPLRSFSAN